MILQIYVKEVLGLAGIFTIKIDAAVNNTDNNKIMFASFFFPMSLKFCINKTPPKIEVKNTENPLMANLE